jgi:1-deoxy-D-xylulose-5-phosphate synthase
MPEWRTPFEKIQIGKGRKVRNGKDLAIISIGHIGNIALESAEMLEKEGISAAVYDARFAKPLDENMLREVFQQFDRIITVEDGCVMGGFGSAVLEFAAENDLHAKVRRLGIPDEVIEHGEQSELYRECGFDAAGIVKTALEMAEIVRL